MTRGLVPVSLAALLAFSGCAVRMRQPSADATPSPRPPVVAPQSPTPPPAPAGPFAGTSSTEAPQAAALEAPRPQTARAEAARPVTGREAPSATASAFVFSPQQAVPAPPTLAPVAERAPDAPPTRDGADGETPTGAGPGELRLAVVASASPIAPGGIMTVYVMAKSTIGVVDAPLDLTFDPSVVEFVDGATGDFLAQGGSSVVFLADGRSRPGVVAIAAGRVERERGAQGAGLLCRVRFRGVSAGTTPVVVAQAKAWGTGGEELTVLGGGISVAVD